MSVYVELAYSTSPTSPTSSVYFAVSPEKITSLIWADGRLMSPLKYKASIKSWVQNGTSLSSVGDIKIANGDGKYDYLLGKVGFVNIVDLDGAGVQAYGKVDRIVADGEKHIIVKLKNPLDELDVPLQTNVFPASEPSEGSGFSPAPTNFYYGMEGQTRPLAFGLCFNIQPFLANRTFNEYHCHDSEVHRIDHVYDDGISVSFTQTTKGFVLASDPSGIIVAEGIMSVGSVPGVRRFDILVPEIMDRISFSNYSSSDCVDINTELNYRYQYYQPAGTNQTARYVLDWLVNSSLCYMYADPDGEIRFGVWDEPKVSADDEIGINQVVGGINIFSDEAPNITSKIGGDRNWYIYNQDEIAFGATDQNKIDFATQWMVVAEGSSTLAYTDNDYVYDSCLQGTSKPSDMADRVTSLYSTRRNFYTFDSTKDASIGDTIELTYPRFGLDSGVNLLVVGREIDFINNTYRLTLWG